MPQSDIAVARDKSKSIRPLSDLASPRALGRTEHERAELDLSHGASDLPERKKRDERDAQKSGDAQRANNAPAANLREALGDALPVKPSKGDLLEDIGNDEQHREQHRLVCDRNDSVACRQTFPRTAIPPRSA